MPRAILPDTAIHPSIRSKVEAHHADIVAEVQSAIAAHAVVVVGMQQNPHPKRAKKLLRERNIAFHDLEYGNYLSGWRRRTALKMWTGWPTFPMVFVRGTLIGGADELASLDASGELATLLA